LKTLDLNKPKDARKYVEEWAARGGYLLDDVDPDLDDFDILMLARQLFLYAEEALALGSSH
jgi:hypothetical protein